MSDKAWDDLISLIDDKYRIDNSNTFEEPIEDHKDLNRTIQRIEFEKDNTKYRIDRVTSPAIVDKKTHYHHRGSANRIEYVYNPEETTTKVMFFQQQGDGYYNEISPESMLA